MVNGGGLVLVGAAGLAAYAAWKERQKKAFISAASGARPGTFSPALDLQLTRLVAVTGSTAITRQSVANVRATGQVVGAVLTALMSVLSTLINIAMGNPYVWIAVAVVLIVAGMIFFEYSADNAQRIKFAIQGMYGSRFTLNRWEFATCRAWLDALKAPYEIVQVRDDYIRTTSYVTDSNLKLVRYADRFCLTKVGLSPQAWDELQLFVRTAALDYFKRITPYLIFTKMNVLKPLGGAVIARLPEASYPPYFEPFESPAAIDASARGWAEAWNLVPLIGDTTAYDMKTVVPSIGTTRYAWGDPGPARTGRSLAPSYETAVARFAGSAPWAQVSINNHFTAISAALSVFKLVPEDPKSAEWGAYAQQVWAASGLTWHDNITLNASQGWFIFNRAYWGWDLILDVRSFKLGLLGAFQIIIDGKPTNLSFDTPRK